MAAWSSVPPGSEQVVQTGRLPLFCFFVAFIAGFVGSHIRPPHSPRRAPVARQYRRWLGDVLGMVFGVS